jgi:RNA polymerase sigma factor (sigma-70 family)
VPTPEARQARVAAHLGLALALSVPFARRLPQHKDDLNSAATLGLVEASAAFDSQGRVPFPAFARHRILGALKDECRKLGKEPVPTDPGAYPAALPSRERPVGAEVDDRDQVEALMDSADLTERQRKVVALVAGGSEVKEAAAEVGISPGHASRVLGTAMAAMNSAADWRARHPAKSLKKTARLRGK